MIYIVRLIVKVSTRHQGTTEIQFQREMPRAHLHTSKGNGQGLGPRLFLPPACFFFLIKTYRKVAYNTIHVDLPDCAVSAFVFPFCAFSLMTFLPYFLLSPDNKSFFYIIIIQLSHPRTSTLDIPVLQNIPALFEFPKMISIGFFFRFCCWSWWGW